MKIIEPIIYNGLHVLTTEQLSNILKVEKSTVNRNFQRNKDRYEEGKHFILLTGESLKKFKRETEQKESLKYVSSLYLWAIEGAILLAKSCRSEDSWEVWEALKEELHKIYGRQMFSTDGGNTEE
ncbi:ORF6N domain-containing protein [Lederbergia citrisecunda]|uniref:ORF6N domain-containing protein n=1 Tax=Lederbergia citrisecunda TaxID=2833583 RepID=UPI003D28EA9D